MHSADMKSFRVGLAAPLECLGRYNRDVTTGTRLCLAAAIRQLSKVHGSIDNKILAHSSPSFFNHITDRKPVKTMLVTEFTQFGDDRFRFHFS